MDIFEYAVLRLVFRDASGMDRERERYTLHVLYYEVAESGEVVTRGTQVDLKRQRLDDEQPYERRWGLTPTFAITALAPQMARMGREGWEVIQYSFNSDTLRVEDCGNEFSQALLKRRISAA